ncbi:hypothetical protein Q1695_000946 [Nippostrongylus brasiliensis]|nr:hypothetical protein Q1695_000946 [Nippostrongylus brasiliensis]
MILLIILGIVSSVSGQNACFSSNLTVPQNLVCNQIKAWDAASRNQIVPAGDSLTPGHQPLRLSAPAATSGATSSSLPTDRYQCFNFQCLCQFYTGARWNGTFCNLADGTVLQKVVRKEYRQMTPAERELFRQGFLSVRNSIYQTLSTAHSNVNQSPGAHSGPNFLPWHRELLKRLEFGIRTTAVTVNGQTAYPYANMFVPYWDSTLDDNINLYMGLSSDTSMMFSSNLMGSVISGDLVDGQFANFVGTIGEVTQRSLDQYPNQLYLFQAATVNTIVTQQTVNQVLAATAGDSGCPAVPNSNIELRHGDVHVWMGGFMQTITTSTNDPIFFLHHSFIDNIWEQWRQNKQTPTQRETQWNTGSTSCYSAAHRITATMVPFTGMINSGGLSNQYTDNLYSYSPPATCSSSNPNGCNSDYLFCNTQANVCVARIKPGTQCSLINGGTCVGPSSDAPRNYPTPLPQPLPIVDELCYNMNQCCGPWTARGECQRNPGVMRVVCPASCGWCSPAYNLGDNCANRSQMCKIFVLAGECSKNYQWMAENCRKECAFCANTREQMCPGKEILM